MDVQSLKASERGAVDHKISCWVEWCRTRRIYVPAARSNTLTRLQPKRIRAVEPDSFLDPDMPFFNTAIHALCEQPELAGEAECFLGVYWYRTNIKALAHQQNCARGTVYNRARRFAQRAELLGRTIRHKQC